MSLLSRNTGGRRTARLAAVFAGTLLMYLVVTAVPAFALSTCAVATTTVANDTLNVAVGTDDSLVLEVAGTYMFSVNGGAFVTCGAAATTANVDWVHVTGSDAGKETFTMFHPQDWSGPPNTSTTVDLGNGTDTLVVEYGGLSSPAIADPANNDTECLGSAAGGILVGDQNCGGVADLRIANAETIVINGGEGDDSLDAGNLGGIGANDPVAGTLADNIPAAANPFAGNLTLNGGNGDDTLVSGNGDDNFVGGAGADTVSYEAASGPVTVSLTAEKGAGMGNDTLSDVQNATGGDFNDKIQGSALNNILIGGDGDDTLAGFGGDDDVQGNDGDDTIIEEGPGANGADTLSGGLGDDTLDYSIGRTTDTIVKPAGGAVSGNDANSDGTAEENDTVLDDFETIMTGSGNDTVVGAANALTILTGGGQDLITGSSGDDTIDPGTGINQVDGSGGSDTLDLSSQTGPTTTTQQTVPFFGTPTEVWVAKSDAPAFANAFASVETVIGTGQDDLVQWDGTAPALFDFAAGGGTDTVDASSAAVAVVINLSTFGNGNEVENAIGGAGNDTLTGNNLNNTLTGNDGDDAITAGTGNDIVEGGLGNDTLTDGGGADTLVYRNAPSGETIDTANGFASGGDGDDTISGQFETVLGSDFADNITAGQTAFDLPNIIKGFAGNDNITGSNSTDTLAGGKGNDNVHGGGGDDTIKGSGGNDTLLGSSGDDTIKGGNGNDSLVGGKGYDVGNGGKGKDTCKQIEVAHSC